MNISKDKIIKIINEICENNLLGQLDYDVDLCLSGIDSILFIQIIVFLEDEFDCEIPDEFLDINKMNTVDKIYNVLKELKHANG